MVASDLYARAKLAWPRLVVDEAAFAEALADEDGTPREVAPDRASDLYLAVACARGVPGAADELERAFIAPALAAMARRERDAAVVDEVGQALRVRLLVADDTRPARIAEYRGQGALASWVRVVAARLHADHHRARGRGLAQLDDDAELASLSVGVDLSAAKREHKELVDRALRETLASLSLRERTLLRMAYVDGLPLSRIGAMHGVDKATVSRRLAALRGRVADLAMARLADAIGASTDEARSLFALLASSLDVSMTSVLGAAAPAG